MRVKDTSIILRGTINLNENVIISDKEMVACLLEPQDKAS